MGQTNSSKQKSQPPQKKTAKSTTKKSSAKVVTPTEESFSFGEIDDDDDELLMGDRGFGSYHRDTSKPNFATHNFGDKGWVWSKAPKTDKTSYKNGEIVFNIEIDQNGKVLNVITHKSTVDQALLEYYMQECYNLRFVRILKTPPSATTQSTITFSFKAR